MFLTALMLAGTSSALSELQASAFVSGQPAWLRALQAPPGGLVAYVLSVQGLGSGLCLEANTCLGLLDPLSLLGVGFANGAGEHSLPLSLPPQAPLLQLFFQNLTVDLSSFSLATSNTLAVQLEPLSALGDEFPGTALASAWSVLHPELAQISVFGGELHIRPTAAGLANIWFNDAEGVLVHKRITGNFEAIVRARAFDPGNPAQPPPLQYRLGGLLVRNPLDLASGTHDFSHIALGAGDIVSGFAVEHKLTIDSASQFSLSSIPYGPRELCLRRLGAQIELLERAVGSSSWHLLAVHQHPEFPAELELGLMAYPAEFPASLELAFDFLSLSEL